MSETIDELKQYFPLKEEVFTRFETDVMLSAVPSGNLGPAGIETDPVAIVAPGVLAAGRTFSFSTAGTYVHFLDESDDPIVIASPGAGNVIMNGVLYYNGTYWQEQHDVQALPSVDLSNYTPLPQFTAAIGNVTAPTAGVAAGMSPVAIGTSSFGDGGNKACVVGNYTGAAKNVYSVTIAIDILGSGAIKLLHLSGTAPSFTVISKIDLTVSATGLKTFTQADFGTILMATGDSLGFEFVSGGATIWAKAETGNTGYYFNGSSPTGTQTWTTLANTRYCAGYLVEGYPTISLPRASIAPAFETQISTVEKNAALVPNITAALPSPAGMNPVLSGSGTGTFGAGGNRYCNGDPWTGVAGYLASVTLNVLTLGDGLINIVRASGTLPSQTFISRKSVTLTGTGVQTITLGVNEIPMNPGDSINIEFPSATGGATIANIAETGHTAYFKTGGLMAGTVTLSSVANVRYYVGYAVTIPQISVKYSGLDATVVKDIGYGKEQNRSRYRTMLYDQAFGAGSAVPSPWTVTAGWTVASNYLIAPSGSTGMGVYATDNTQINVQESTRRFIVNAIASGSIIGIGGRIGPVADANLGSLFSINYSTNKINLHAAWVANTTTQPAVYVSATPGFTLTVGVDYLVEIFRDRRNIWLQIYDPITGASASVGNDGNTLVGSNFAVGEMGDYLTFLNLAGQSKFKNPCALVNKSNTGTYIVGDSLTEAYGILITQGWAQLAAADSRSVTVISGRSGDKASGMGTRAVSEMHQILPKRSIFHGGTNDTGTGLTGFQTGFTAWLNQCITDGVKPCAVRLAQRTGGDVSAINAWLDTQNIPLIRADIATTTGFDGVTKNAACFIADGIHYSALGAQLIFQRIAIDFPYFYD